MADHPVLTELLDFTICDLLLSYHGIAIQVFFRRFARLFYRFHLQCKIDTG